MKGAALLLAHSLKRSRTLAVAMGLLLAGFQFVLILVARSIQNSNGFDQLSAMLPSFAREMMGPSLTSFMSFKGIVCLGYFHLAIMSALIALAIVISTTPVSEIETGFMDLILSRPLARHWVVTRTIAAVTICTLGVLAMMMAGTALGLRALAPPGVTWPPVRLVVSLAVNLGLLMLCWSGVALAIAAGSRRRSVAGALAGLLALTTFLLDYVGRLWKPAESIAWLSPFRYYNPYEMVMGHLLPAENIVVLASVAIAGYATAYILFARRDISH